MEATIVLLVKGTEEEARAAAAAHGLDVTGSRAVQVGLLAVKLRARGPAGMLMARAVWWLAEPGEAPFPSGTLLAHGPPETGEEVARG